jgi:hypothetical protein
MSFSYGPTIDDLLTDSLIQMVMRADHVEPRSLKLLLHGVASQIGDASPEHVSRRPAIVFVGSPNERRSAFGGGNGPSAARRPAPVRDSGCGSALCC